MPTCLCILLRVALNFLVCQGVNLHVHELSADLEKSFILISSWVHFHRASDSHFPAREPLNTERHWSFLACSEMSTRQAEIYLLYVVCLPDKYYSRSVCSNRIGA